MSGSASEPFASESALPFGQEGQPNGMPPLQSRVMLAHVLFKAAALASYLFANMLGVGYVLTFVLVTVLSALDFWTVKNVSGRLLVGLRWWNHIDEAVRRPERPNSRNTHGVSPCVLRALLLSSDPDTRAAFSLRRASLNGTFNRLRTSGSSIRPSPTSFGSPYSSHPPCGFSSRFRPSSPFASCGSCSCSWRSRST